MDNGTYLPPMQRAIQAADCLIRRGVPAPFRNDLIAVIFQAITQTETDTRKIERQSITAEWLTQVLPGDVIQLAAEKVAAQTY